MSLKLVLISDTHNQMNKIILPEGDVLVHAGDHTNRGSLSEVTKAMKDLAEKGKNFSKIITIAGNHDWLFETEPNLAKQICEDNGIYYLRDEWLTVEGKIFYGSPWQPTFCNWAFNLPRGAPLHNRWNLIPEATDVLITHGPVKDIRDLCPNGFKAGCQDLFDRVMEVKPELHVCGHIHHSYGVEHFDGITFVNASMCDERYQPVNKPIEIELE